MMKTDRRGHGETITRQAENALKLATTIAKSCGHGYIGTEHLLAGLLKEPEGTAGKVLQELT